MSGLQTMTSMYAPAASMYAQAIPSYAPPATYAAAAPTMTSMYMPTASYAPATTTYAAPATTAYAAPAVIETFAAPSILPPTMVAAPSYVPAPVQQFPQFAVAAPANLTAGLETPAQIDAERQQYERALAAQLKKQSDAVMEEANIKKAMLTQQAQSQMEQYNLGVDEKLQIACLQVEQAALNEVNGLKEAAITQQTSAEERAAMAVFEYNKRKAIQDCNLKTAQLQQQWADGEIKMMNEYEQVRRAGSKAVVTPGMAI